MPKLIAGYKYGRLNTVIEYGPDSGNPDLTEEQATERLTAEHPDSIIFVDSWDELPENRSQFFPNRIE